MRAHCIRLDNPFDPLGSRAYAELRRAVRVRSLAPRGTAPVIAILNGRPLLRCDARRNRRQSDGWRRRLRDGDHLVFITLPRGRGGGSNPLQLLLSLAIMVFAPFAVSLLGPAFASCNVFTGVTTFTALGNAAVLGLTMAGNALVSALIPQQSGGALSIPAASPTCSLQAQGNAARLENAIPVHNGRLLFSPDLAAMPYTEFVGGELFLYQLMCLGAGEFSIEDIRIEDTPITSFSEVTTEVVAPGAALTLFPSAVISSVEVSGQTLAGLLTGTWSRTTTTITVTQAAHGRAVGQGVWLNFTTGAGPTGFYTITGVTTDTFTVTVATGTGSGNVEIFSLLGGVGGFVANGAGTLANRLAFDLVLPFGLFGLSGAALTDKSVTVKLQAVPIDSTGVPTGAWVDLATEVLTDRTSTPVRKSFSYPVTPGRYSVRLYRVDVKDTTAGVGHEVVVYSLRAYLREPQSFGAVTLLAVRMRASNNLSAQASRRIKVLATRKVPVWNGTIWSAPVATTSLAWAIADAARDTVYGAGLADTRIDLAALLALDAIWAARGDTFNGRFDQMSTWWDAVTRIASAGRARVFMQGGILRLVRDQAASVPVALFSMRNIVKGSFSVDHLLSDDATADAVRVRYFDAAIWAPNNVTATLPGSTAVKPVTVEPFGITDGAQALREGLYLAAVNRYRRRPVRFATEMEGFIPSFGDLIAIQHDMPAWGKAAEAVRWNAGTLTLTLSEPVIFGTGPHYVGLRKRGGGESGPWAVRAGATAYEVILSVTPDITPYTGGDEERTHVVFGTATTLRTLARVVTTKPRGLRHVDIEAITEDPSVHTADQGVVSPPIITSTLPRAVTLPVVQGLLGRAMPGDSTRVLIAWQPAPGADHYRLEMAEGTDPADPNVTWTRVADTTATSYVLQLLAPAKTLIRVRGVGLGAGPWNTTALGALIGLFFLADTATFYGADGATFYGS